MSRRVETHLASARSPRGTRSVELTVAAADMDSLRQQAIDSEAAMVARLLAPADPDTDGSDDDAADALGLDPYGGTAPDDPEEPEEPGGPEAGSPGEVAVFAGADLSATEASRHRAEELAGALAARNRDVARLEAALEALQPLPGLDARRLRALFDGAPEEECDLRDAKIIALSKKLRGLNVALQREKDRSRGAARALGEREGEVEALRREVDGLRERLRRLGGGPSSDHNPSGNPNPTLRREHEQLRKQVAELRRRHELVAESNRRLSAALRRETGEDAAAVLAEDGGWRGRAERIALLKSKVRRLENRLRERDAAAGGGAAATDVDARAEGQVRELQRARRLQVEELRAESERHRSQLEESAMKREALRARLSTVQEEAARLKGSVKVMLNKADTDDRLIAALREELAKARAGAGARGSGDGSRGGDGGRGAAGPGAQSGAGAQTGAGAPAGAGAGTRARGGKGAEELQQEVQRLKKLGKRQGDLIDRQERTIQALRAQLHELQVGRLA